MENELETVTEGAVPQGSPQIRPRPEISLILPAYDEEANIGPAIREAERALGDLASRYEIFVVDDGSRDETASRVREASVEHRSVRLLSHAENRGYGAALRTGFSAARFELVAFTDADRQFHIEDLSRLIRSIRGHDVACGYRVGRQDPWLRRFYSWGYNGLVRCLLGLPIRDCDCALKLFRRRVLRETSLDTDGFLVNAELLTRLRLQGARIAETGVRHRPRCAGVSTVSPFDALPVLGALMRFWWTTVVLPRVVRRAPAIETVGVDGAGSRALPGIDQLSG